VFNVILCGPSLVAAVVEHPTTFPKDWQETATLKSGCGGFGYAIHRNIRDLGLLTSD
jgi:hypothetical protein